MRVQLFKTAPRFRWMRLRWIGFILSGGLVILSAALLAMPSVGLNFGIDFRGGIAIELRAQGPIDVGALRQTVNGLDLGEASIQEFGQPTDALVRLPVQEGGEAAQQAAVAKVRAELGAGYEFRRVEFVGPRVGGELVRSGLIAVGLAILGIGAYIAFRFEWQFGVAALLALLHDVVTTVGAFALLQYEFNLTSLAAVLTVAGYSINDTVVIFDRVRENLRKYKTMDLAEVVDLSCNETLARTILTSGTTLLAVTILYFFGGEVISSFAFAIIWGIVAGTYSSVLLAAPLLLYMRPRRGAAPAAA